MKTYYVDSFTHEPFKGNPAAVCFPARELAEPFMKDIAAEIGFSETAFVMKMDGNAMYSIRFFSPKQEIPLCGHATIAAAKVLFYEYPDLTELNFINVEGRQLVTRRAGESITMEFPVNETIPFEVPEAMLSALGIQHVNDARYSAGNKIVLLEMEDAGALGNLKPDFQALLLSYTGINGVLVTAKSGDESYDFHYRYFWPWAGTNEDPVTGSVQTFLSGFWAAKLQKKKMNAFQSSQRTGHMVVELIGEKVLITGDAVIVLTGEFMV